MKPHLDIAHSGTLEAARTRMTFDENSIAHLMSVLTDLYSDQEMAVIREYSINGTDSHRAAGIDKPIEVTLPTELMPLFIVKDYGVGMSARDIYDNFSKYGWSSKRDNDVETGMLGLGCKAALAYTSQFTMVCVKDGIENIVLVTRETDGAGAVQIVETTETDQSDGVEVRVPVKTAHTFNRKVHWFFRFWDRGTVLLDGEPVVPYEDTAALVLDPDIIMTESVDYDYLVMGGVPYPLPENQRLSPRGRYGPGPGKVQYSSSTLPTGTFSITGSTTTSGSNNAIYVTTTNTGPTYIGNNLQWKHNSPYHVIVRVPMGSINFTPSREQLQLTKRTIDTVSTAREFIYDRFHLHAQNDVASAETYKDAMDKASRWCEVWNTGPFFYNGYEVRNSFWAKDAVVWRWDVSYSECSKAGGQMSYDAAYKALHVIGHTPGQVHSATKKRVKTYMEENGLTFRSVFFYEHEFGSPWLDDVTKVDYLEIRAIKNPTFRNKPPTGFRVLQQKGTSAIWDKVADPNLGRTFWMHSGEYRMDREDMYGFFRTLIGAEPQLVLVTKEAAKSFQAENPDMPYIYTFLEQKVQEFIKSLSAAEIIYIKDFQAYEELGFHHLSKYLRSKAHRYSIIQDADLRLVLSDVENIREHTRRVWGSIESWLPRLAVKVPALEAPQEHLDCVKRVRARYPMLTHTNHFDYRYGNQGPEIIQYINGAYLLSQLGSLI